MTFIFVIGIVKNIICTKLRIYDNCYLLQIAQILIILLFICTPLLGWSQTWYNDPGEHPGAVVTIDKSVYRGKIRYNQSGESLICRSAISKRNEFLAKEVLYFQFYDDEKALNRYFFSYPVKDKKNSFFELLLSGDISIYRKAVLTNAAVAHRKILPLTD